MSTAKRPPMKIRPSLLRAAKASQKEIAEVIEQIGTDPALAGILDTLLTIKRAVDTVVAVSKPEDKPDVD